MLKPFIFYSFCFFSFHFLNAQSVLFKTNADTSQLFVSVSINNKTHLFLFDNAAEKSILFFEAASDIKNYQVKAKTFVFDAEQKKDTAYIVNCSVGLPELTIKNEKLTILATPFAPKQLKSNGVSGILGLDIINQYNWQIDFNTNTISILKKINDSMRAKYYVIPTIKDKFSVMSITVKNEVKTDTFAIDFGHNQTLSTGVNAFAKTKEYVKISQLFTINQNALTDTSYFCLTNNLVFGNILSVTNLPISYSPKTKSNLIGIGFLKKFGTVIMMNKNNQLLLEQKESTHFTLNAYVLFENRLMSMTQKTENDGKIGTFKNKLNFPLMDASIPKKISLAPTFYKIIK